jgi:hypothetical protein
VNKLDSYSIVGLKAQDIDFYELSTLVKDIRAHLDIFRKEQSSARLPPLEISERLITPLQNLDELYTTLFTENEKALNEAQRKYLKICEQLVAHCYCYIHKFTEPTPENIAIYEISENAQNLNYKFYYYAAYELRTPASGLKGYSEATILRFMGIDVPPFLPENQEQFDKINFWVEEFLKFINNLPDIWKAYQPENAA